MAKRRIIPQAAVNRLIKKAGADRVSPDSVRVLSEILEDIANDIASRAVRMARYAKRKTITREDIELAASE